MVANLPVEEWHAVHQRLRRIAKRRAELDAEEARSLREAERIQLWRRLGYVHMGEYLERELGYAPHPGAERLRVARALAELPQLEAALGQGELHYSAVRELSRVATRETEAEWIETARGKNVRQVEAEISGHKRGDRPDSPTSPDLVNRVVRLELSPDVFALFRQAQATLADEHGGRLDDNAFIQALCRRAIEGSGAADDARPAHQIAITVCQSCKRGWQNGAGREIEVGPEVIERAKCDAEHLGSLDAAQPARVTATVTPRLRRQVLARDHHCCTAPGCRSARNLDLHHIRYQSEGGSHEIGNVTTLCTGHHRQLHEGALVIRGRAPDDLEFTWRAPAAPAAAGIAQAHSHQRPDTYLHVPGAVAPMPPVSDEPGQSHRGSDLAASVVSDEPGQYPRGPQTNSHAPGIAAAVVSNEPGRSHGGPEIAAAVVSNELGQSHRGPEGIVHAPGNTIPVEAVEQAQFHGGLTRPHRPATETASVVNGDATGPARTQRRSSMVESASHRNVRVSPPHRASTASSIHDDVARDVRDALTTAGYKAHEARHAVDEARSHVGPGATLEQLLREALRRCVRSTDRR